MVNTGARMQSYPNCRKTHFQLNNPDARHLAEVAEANGLDFRIMLLTRDAESILSSTAINRPSFGPSVGKLNQLYIRIIITPINKTSLFISLPGQRKNILGHCLLSGVIGCSMLDFFSANSDTHYV